MGLQVALKHKTHYLYQRPVSLGPQTIRLRPTPHCRTPIVSYSLDITPDCEISWHFDQLANHIARALFPGRTDNFRVEVNLIADLSPINAFGFLLDRDYEDFPFTYSAELEHDLRPFLGVTQCGQLLPSLTSKLSRNPQPTVSFLVGLNAVVREEVQYVTRMESGVQSCEETLRLGTGSCRDSAWLLVQICRQLGIAARFVSGYLIQTSEADESAVRSKLDSADLHAWTEVYVPGAGWVGMDPTSGLLSAAGHIPLASSSTPSGAAPIMGTVEPAEVNFTHTLSVRRLIE